MPGAVFVGFTGTPLLKEDKGTTMEVFGSYIHAYKFKEAVIDEVVLDLVYEARDIEQQLGSQDKIDQWFESKTKGLNGWQKAALREQWGTMQKVLSSRSRMERVVEDILFDFGVKPRLISQRGNAMLVASSIYEAARYYELFQKTPFKGRCAVVTSYNPQAQDVTKEETGANTETDKQFLYNLYTALLKDVKPKPGKSPTETYEDEAKRLFIKQAVASLLRAYANIADDMPQAGYKETQIAKIKTDVTRAVELREHIRLASGETIDLKAYEADMRHLIDTYIEARDPKKISAFDDMGLLEVIERSGLAEAIAQLPDKMRKNKDAVAETIANNVRSKIIKEHLNDPAFYDKMSALLKEILDDLKAKRISYEKFLKRLAEEVIKPVQKGTDANTPTELNTPAKRALYSNLPEPRESSMLGDVDVNPRLQMALHIDYTVRNSRPDNWRGNVAKENLIKQALLPVLNFDEEEVERIFPVIIAQTEY